ncbi:MAG: hypothetical protein PHT69_16100, partial [Bacteroidales bacterium]|nr:hypothetical protein [Bacteroidales bacterium]
DDMFVYKGINVFPEQFREIISEFNDLSGNYKIKLKKESHNIIPEIHLICERRHTSSTDTETLRKALLKRISTEIVIKPFIEFVNYFPNEGNKHKTIEYI